MKVQFIDPHEKLPNSILSLGYSHAADFHLKIGINYTVYGISIWKTVIHYLIIPSDLTLPNWLPADLFKIIDPSISPDWYFRYLGENDPSEITLKIGYREIALDDNHDFDLIERKEEAIKIFLTRKIETESG